MGALRFWTRDIWGPRWDRERRGLLLKHYWSYLRHPPVAAHQLHASGRESIEQQRTFCQLYQQRIADVQRHGSRRRGVRLTFRPLGKNLRLLGTALRRNVDDGAATFIEPDGPADEVASLAESGRHWHPWLWSRTGTPAVDAQITDAASAWTVLFKPFDTAAADRSGVPPSSLKDPQLERLLKIAVATRAVFQPINQIETDLAALKSAVGWPAPNVPVLGLHVRRSDAASAESDGPARSNRESFGLPAYLDAVDRVCDAHGIRHVFFATESAIEIARARDLRPGYTFLTLPYDRSLFPDIGASRQFIEHLVLTHPERARALAISAILDLRLFCECSAFVGAFNSEFSMLAWLLTIGSRGHVVPYVSLSRPRRRPEFHPHDALLNVRNNCPLELYHW